jgi:hypothetical protein
MAEQVENPLPRYGYFDNLTTIDLRLNHKYRFIFC